MLSDLERFAAQRSCPVVLFEVSIGQEASETA